MGGAGVGVGQVYAMGMELCSVFEARLCVCLSVSLSIGLRCSVLGELDSGIPGRAGVCSVVWFGPARPRKHSREMGT